MSEFRFTKSADTKHKVKLDPLLIYAEWAQGVLYADAAAAIEVGTLFVGEGAPIEIEAKLDSGKKIEKVKARIYHNKFVGTVNLPADVKRDDVAYFKVKLGGNNLEGESNRLPILPAIKVVNMSWNASEARRGDRLKLTAELKNVLEGTEATVNIYEYDRDGAHDPVTQLPTIIRNEKMELIWEYQYTEDSDEIATQEELDKYGSSYNPPEYFFTIQIGAQEYGKKNQDSGLLLFKDNIDFFAKFEDGTPIANTDFVITLPDGSTRNGTTDEAGHASFEDVPPGPYHLEFKFDA